MLISAHVDSETCVSCVSVARPCDPCRRGALACGVLRPAGADDAIGRLMHAQDEPAKNLPVAPPKPLPPRVPGRAWAPSRKVPCPS